MSDAPKRHRTFWITDNAITHSEWMDELQLEVDFRTLFNNNQPRLKCIIVAKDIAPTTGKEHLHILAQFTNACANSALQACAFPRAATYHIEFPKTEQHLQNSIKYAREKEWYREFGVAPISKAQASTIGGERTKQKFIDAFESCKRGKFEEIPPDMWFKYNRAIIDISNRFCDMPAIEGDDDILKKHMFYFFGLTRTGKSWCAREIAKILSPDEEPYVMVSPAKPWWDNYRMQKVVIVDEMPEHLNSDMKTNWKQWLDRYPFKGEVKGSSYNKIRPPYIIICSNYPIWTVFGRIDKVTGNAMCSEDSDAVEARVTTINFERVEKHMVPEYVQQKKAEVMGIIGFTSPNQEPPAIDSSEAPTQPLSPPANQELIGDLNDVIIIDEDQIRHEEYEEPHWVKDGYVLTSTLHYE